MAPETMTKRQCEPVRRFGRAEDGTAAVEFALCLPLLLVLLFAGIEIGRLLIDFHVVSKSLRDSGRYLSQVGISCTAPGTVALSAAIENAADETIARNLALTGTPDAPATAADYLLSYWTGAGGGAGNLTMEVACVANTAYQGIYQGAPLIGQITVDADVPFSFIWGSTFISLGTLTMNISHRQPHIGG